MSGSGRSRSVNVALAEASTDVLVWLCRATPHSWYTAGFIAENVAPAGADDPLASTKQALALLVDAGCVEAVALFERPVYRVTDEGRAAVEKGSSSLSAPARGRSPPRQQLHECSRRRSLGWRRC